MPKKISQMTVSATLPAGGYVPYVDGASPNANFIYDLGADLSGRPTNTGLALSTAAAAIGSIGPSNVQFDLNARVKTADLASTATGKGGALVAYKQTGTGASDRTLLDDAAKVLSLGDFGVTGAGTETTKAQNAINAAGLSPVLVDNVALVGTLSNPLGVDLYGPGSIQKTASQGGVYQDFNQTYTDKLRSSAFKNNLFRIFQRIRNGGTLKGFVYGNSVPATAANGGGYANTVGEPQVIIPLMLKAKGVRNPISITNRAVGGTKISDMNALGDIAVDTDFFMINYGINDIADGLAGFAANMDAKLSAIRNHVSGFGITRTLAIILIGPTSTYDPEHGRTNIFYEKVRRIFIAAAIKWNCFYYDPYALMHDVSWCALAESEECFDDPFGNGQAVHPREIPQALWIADMMDQMIGYSDLTIWDSRSLQTPTLRSSWVNFGGGTQDSYYSMDRNGVVTIYGNLKSGTQTSGVPVLTVAEGYYPLAQVSFLAACGASFCRVRVNPTNGDVELQDAAPNNTQLNFLIQYPTR